jgi:hypothetical protein
MLASKGLMASSAVEPIYVDDVFSTWLYTGTGASQTITNGIDLAGEGGLVWLKERSASDIHNLYDTNRGATYLLSSDSAGNQNIVANSLTSFNANGFTLGDYVRANESSQTYVSWTFRKAPKFFDVVTYTGTGSARTVAHNLGSVPGMMIVKRTNTTGNWQVYHRSGDAEFAYLVLNNSAQSQVSSTRWNDTAPTASVFSLGTDATVNASGGTYVAYLFAHDAGGFGESGTDNAVSCGSYAGNGSSTGTVVNLGYEPQWLLIKRSGGLDADWVVFDNMRGVATGGNDALLYPNLSSAEVSSNLISFTATGFQLTSTDSIVNASSVTPNYIYLAIRRPNKPPTIGTQVFSPLARTGTGTATTVNGLGFPLDLIITKAKSNAGYQIVVRDRLRGTAPLLQTHATSAEITDTTAGITSFSMDGFVVGADNVGTLSNTTNQNTIGYINWAFKRAPGFFDVVCYTGTGANTTQAHNLTVAPELMIVKNRSVSGNWSVYASTLGGTQWIRLNVALSALTNIALWNYTDPSSDVFTVGTSSNVNTSGSTYVAYLFATLSGISKVGSYTGTGTTLQVNCGFTTGARFVLIKRTDTDGAWYVWDTARGIISGNDPYLLLNSTAAEVTNTDYVDPLASGFEISSTAPAEINASGGTYIFLAIA